MTSKTPRTLWVAAVLLGVVALASLVMGVLEGLNTRAHRPVVGVGGAIILLGYAVGLVVVARGLLRRRRWSRGPAVATQLIQLPVAWSFAGGSTWPVAIALGGVSLTVIACVLHPASTRVLVDAAPEEE